MAGSLPDMTKTMILVFIEIWRVDGLMSMLPTVKICLSLELPSGIQITKTKITHSKRLARSCNFTIVPVTIVKQVLANKQA